jgi:hypothetical protein
VSWRDFLSLLSAAAGASSSASLAGIPSLAIAAPSGKLAYLSFDVNEYNTQASPAFKQAADAFGLQYLLLDGQEDGQKQVDQFEQEDVSGVRGAVFNLADGGSIRLIASLGQHYTLYAVPQEFIVMRSVTSENLKQITASFGGGKIIA